MGKGLIQEGHVDEVERHRVGLGVLLVGVLRGLELPTCARLLFITAGPA